MRDRGQGNPAEKLMAIAYSSQEEGLQGVCGALAGVRYLSRLPDSCYVKPIFRHRIVMRPTVQTSMRFVGYQRCWAAKPSVSGQTPRPSNSMPSLYRCAGGRCLNYS